MNDYIEIRNESQFTDFWNNNLMGCVGPDDYKQLLDKHPEIKYTIKYLGSFDELFYHYDRYYLEAWLKGKKNSTYMSDEFVYGTPK